MRSQLGRGVLGRALDQVDWAPAPLDLSAVKTRLAQAVAERMRGIGGGLALAAG